MRKSLLAASALVGVALLANSSADAKKATYVTVAPPAGATSVSAFGINDDNIVAGTYRDSNNLAHGFYGPPDGSNYTTFDFAGDGTSGTQPRGILNDGTITGIGLGGAFTFGEEFVRLPDGKFKVLKRKKLVFDGVVQGGNDHDQFVGDYINKSGTRTGFLGKNGRYLSDITLNIRGITSTDPRQINDHGQVGGSYVDSGGIQHGFILDGKHLTTFDYPDAVGVTAPEGINNKGQVTGLWQDSSATRHGFLFDSTTGDFTEIGPADGDAHEAWGINNKGMISGDSSGAGVSWIYCPLKASRCPHGASAREVEVRTIHVPRSALMHSAKLGRKAIPVRSYQNKL